MKKQKLDIPDAITLMMTSEEASTMLHALSYPLKDEEIQRAMFPDRHRRDAFVATCRRLKAALQGQVSGGAIYGRC